MKRFAEEVAGTFVHDLSSRLGIDLTWTLEARAESLAEVTQQYQAELDRTVYKKDGARNQNPNRQGNHFEVRDAFLNNVEEAALNSGVRYYTTDHLHQIKESGGKLSPSMREHSNRNDEATDVVAVKNGRVVSKAQYKSVKNFAHLGEERYIRENNELVVPPEDFDAARGFWEKKRSNGDPRAAKVLAKLKRGKASKVSVSQNGSLVGGIIESVENKKDAKRTRQAAADNLLLTEASLTSGAATIAHSSVSIAHTSLRQAISYIIGRCVVEIRASLRGDSDEKLAERIRIVLRDSRDKFKGVFAENLTTGLIDSVLSFILGMISRFFRNASAALKKGGDYVRIICRELADFVLGRASSLYNTVAAITKAIAGLSVVTLAFGLQEYLVSAGLPDYLAIIVTAFVSALLTVSIFKLIDSVTRHAIRILAARDAAKLRREEIEMLCAEALPHIEDQLIRIDQIIENEDRERSAIFESSYVEIRASLTTSDIASIAKSYERLYSYLGIELPFTNAEEFDAFMSDDKPFSI